MIAILAAVLAAAAPQTPPDDADCERHPPAPSIEVHPQPVEPSGDGLWIAGHAFGRDDIASAAVGFDEHTGWPVIDLVFSEDGQQRFIAAQRCRVTSTIEVSRDGKVLSRPVLNEYVLGPSLRISGVGSVEETQDFALQLTERD